MEAFTRQAGRDLTEILRHCEQKNLISSIEGRCDTSWLSQGSTSLLSFGAMLEILPAVTCVAAFHRRCQCHGLPVVCFACEGP
jgi:hypothetical protein